MTKEQQYNYALLNKAIYDPNPQSVLNETERGKKYTILQQNVNDMTVKDKKTGKIILVIKGTDISNLKGQRQADLIQDLGILLNNKEMVTRTKEMENKTEDLIRKYGKNNVTITGHSLAGYIASEISGDLDVPAVAFNIGSSPFNRTQNNRVKGNKSTTHYTTNTGSNFDPVSLTAARVDNYNRVQVEPDQAISSGILKYHTIDHFLEKENNNIDNNKKMTSDKKLKRNPNWKKNLPKKVRLEPSYITEGRRQLKEFIADNSKKTMKELDSLSDTKLREISTIIKRTKEDLSRRKLTQRATDNRAKEKTKEFYEEPSYSRQKEAISAEVDKVTGLPTDISDIISEYAGEPDIRFKTVPKYFNRIPQARRLFVEIIEETGDYENFKDILTEDYGVTDKRQLSDKKVLEILNDVDDKDIQLMLAGDNADLATELKALKGTLSSKSRIQSETEEEEKYDDSEKNVQVDNDEPSQYDYGYGTSDVIGDSGYQNQFINNARNQNPALNDNFIRGVNSYSSFQTNPSIPVRRQFRNISRQIDNTPMRIDPDPSTYPEESLLQQNAILEGNPDVMIQVDPESSRGNLSYATTNMASYEQNQLMADTRNTRRRVRIEASGEGDEGDYSDDEEEGKYNRDDDRLFDQDDENELNNRERVELELEMESARNLGRWSGDNRSRLNDFQRSARDKKDANSIRDSAFLNSLRSKPIPWQRPSRTYQNNSVGLIRNSNRSMQLAVGELIP